MPEVKILFDVFVRVSGKYYKQGEEVKGIAPLMIGPNEILGKYFRELGFIGSRWEVDRPAFIFPESSDACLIATLKCLQDSGYW